MSKGLVMYWWENKFLSARKEKLFLGKYMAADLAEKWGTPLYVYSREQIQSNLERLYNLIHKHIPHEIRICYALKANFNQEILKHLKELDVWIDAVSPGEVDIALQSGFKAAHILFTGTSVSDRDMDRIFCHEDVIFNIDAIEQLDIMKEARDRNGPLKRVKVLVRWNPGIGRGFSPKTITAGRTAYDGTPIKFGIEGSRVLSAFQRAAQLGFLPIGLHQHLGSGWTENDFDAVCLAVDRMISMAQDVEKAGFPLEFLDFGGGFGPQYTEEQKVFPLEPYLEYIGDKLKISNLGIQAVAFEPGKYLVGDAGILLMRVEYTKESYGNLFACVDAGTFNTVPRPAIYTQAYHHIINADSISSKKTVPLTVAGNLCESGDVFGKKIDMPPPERGAILALLCAGAYCRSMASNFNLRDIPREILI